MVRTGKPSSSWFEYATAAFLLGSLLVFVPSSFIGEEIFTVAGFAALAALAHLTPKKREVGLGLPTAGALLGLIGLAFCFTASPRTVVFNVFMALFALRAIAERHSLDLCLLGRTLILFVYLTYAMLTLQWLNLDTFYMPNFGFEWAGFSFRPWALGCTATLAIPFIWHVSPRQTLLLLPLILMSRSTACYAVAAFVFGYLCDLRFKCLGKGLLRTLLVASVPLYLLLDVHWDKALRWDRVQVWVNAAKFLTPFGHGLGSWVNAGFVHANGEAMEHWRFAHNDYYQHLYDQGIPGLLLLGLWFFSLILRTKSPILRVAVVVLVALCAFHPMLRWAKLTFFGVVILALAEASIASTNKQEEVQ